MKRIRVGFIGYDGITALDLIGPMDAFASASVPATRMPYELVVIGLTEKPFTAVSGLVIRPHRSLANAGELDTVIVPGGPGSRSPDIARAVGPWLRSHAPHIRRVASVCTGVYLLAQSGLLDDRPVTTHWNHADDVARRFPRLKVNPNAIYLKSDKFYTSAGVTSGIDLALALIEEDFGEEASLQVARELVVYLKRPGGQRQFSEPLRLQVDSTDPFSSLMTWMAGNLSADLSVEALASRVSLSRRHFTRLFQSAFGSSPAEVVEGLRLDEARTLLSSPHATVAGVASAVGFSSADSFRRAFARRFGISPKHYRAPYVQAEA